MRTWLNSSADVRCAGFRRIEPAQFRTPSSRVVQAKASSTDRATSSNRVASASTIRPPMDVANGSSFDGSRPASTRCAPSAASVRATHDPVALPAPMMRYVESFMVFKHTPDNATALSDRAAPIAASSASAYRTQADGDTERQHDERSRRLLQRIANLQVHGAQHQESDQKGGGNTSKQSHRPAIKQRAGVTRGLFGRGFSAIAWTV